MATKKPRLLPDRYAVTGPSNLVDRFHENIRPTINPLAGGFFPEQRERELIELTLELANAPDYYDLARAVDKFDDWYNVEIRDRGDDESEEHWRDRQADRVASRARDRLALIAHDREHPGLNDADSVRDEILICAPTFAITVGATRDSDGDVMHFAQFSGELATVVDYALLLVLTRKRPYYDELRQCAREECGRFFLASRAGKGKGKPPTKYCPGRGCKDIHHRKLSGTERTRKSRAEPGKGKSVRKSTARKPK